ncbi:hypothetical protein [Micromonospora sp. WMMD736]|uniref:hypothetical protein n=1 Tax=Micromonospora sp. WMMD736 TaxID=3404112 RepID=UPI003B95CC64
MSKMHKRRRAISFKTHHTRPRRRTVMRPTPAPSARTRESTQLGLLILAAILATLTLVGALLLVQWDREDWDQRCRDIGGEPTTLHRGQLCMSEDGRILDSR